MTDQSPKSDVVPLGDGELSTLFDWLVPYFPLTLAVSGGVDSICLMHLIATWHSRRGALENHQSIQVITVDHGLRSQAAKEAEFVKSTCLKLGFSHTTLVWRGDKPDTGIQQAARKARYGLISDYLHARQADHKADRSGSALKQPTLVTAHHRDDQAETFVMRLARGSGLDGLAAMKAKSSLNGLTILRPLLQISKARLSATLEARGLSAIEDPSNENAEFERVRLRLSAAALKSAGLNNDMLALSARRLNRAKTALEVATRDLAIRAQTNANGFGYGELTYDVFAAAPEELRIRLLTRLVEFYGGAEPPVRLRKLEELSAAIASPEFGGGTLNRCHIMRRAEKLLILREPGRVPRNAQILTPGQSLLWDHRFFLSLSPKFSEPMRIEQLGEEGWANLKKIYPNLAKSGVLGRAAVTLPALWTKTARCAVPAFAHMEEDLEGPRHEDRCVLSASHLPFNPSDQIN